MSWPIFYALAGPALVFVGAMVVLVMDTYLLRRSDSVSKSKPQAMIEAPRDGHVTGKAR
ncbi:hypothetical protein SAMN05444161_0339 [Rhizobiales bacterium GAS191]|jgi:hypothetical protein|nr:hypothetical protein SAMN05519103_07831 [Rhizobiales bacterium GAS113]SEC01911.1 hypothetical protein SAMN05444161_0339 [Rhizobiales bacterium GAS191]SED17107.1 hypothetical protein SAMN05519104_2951 [Rhizobiales bacterium GAS188]